MAGDHEVVTLWLCSRIIFLPSSSCRHLSNSLSRAESYSAIVRSGAYNVLYQCRATFSLPGTHRSSSNKGRSITVP